MNPRHFVRMARWARHPASDKRVKLVFGIIILCLVIAGIEHFIGWPEWASLEWTSPRSR